MGVRLKKNDRVIVITGKDKGKIGEILQVHPKDSTVLVKGVRLVKRHEKPSALKAGGIVEKEAPIHVSNVAYLDPKTNKPTRLGYKVMPDGRKVRFAKASGETIEG